MELIKAAILGFIEGITEFLPISSTAHLLAGEKLLSFQDEAELFAVAIQLGAILAALWFFRDDLTTLAKGAAERNKESLIFLRNIVIGLIPAGIIGLLVELTVGIPDSLTLIGITLIIGGILLWIIEKTIPKRTAKLDYGQVTWKRALIIGLAQCLAMVPGVSRSGATIASGLMSGLNRPTATAFSFYLSIPIMIAASGLKLFKDYDQLQYVSGGMPALIIGFVAAFITAFLVVGWLLRYVQKNDFKPFAYYRIVAGIILLVFIA